MKTSVGTCHKVVALEVPSEFCRRDAPVSHPKCIVCPSMTKESILPKDLAVLLADPTEPQSTDTMSTEDLRFNKLMKEGIHKTTDRMQYSDYKD